MENPKLSVIIPALNEEKLLPYLLESIKNQENIDLEIIVADNNSEDKTREIAKSFGAKVVEGGLPAKARNNGAKAAKGEILLFLDADVVLPAPDFLEKCVAEFGEKKFDMATCAIVPLSENAIDKLFHQVANFYIQKMKPLLTHAPGFCIFIKKELHESIGGFDEEVKLAEDHDYADRASKNGSFGFLESYPILVSVRRFEKDGRLNIATKYVLCEAHMILKGPIKSDIFKYRFGYKE